jgi:hypothetical protein
MMVAVPRSAVQETCFLPFGRSTPCGLGKLEARRLGKAPGVSTRELCVYQQPDHVIAQRATLPTCTCTLPYCCTLERNNVWMKEVMIR